MKFINKAFFLVALLSFGAKAQPLAEKDWTVLVFLNGINNLDSYGAEDINEMEKVGSTDNVNVVVEWGSYSARKVKRLLVTKDENTNVVSSPILQDLGLRDMGSYKELIDFVSWGIKNYPAKHYMLDVWNHGNGWEKRVRRSLINRDVSYDDISGNRITTEQMGFVMNEIKSKIGRNFDILGFDACLMAMAEVAGEVAESVDYMVASEDLEPGDGWPYDDFLSAIHQGDILASPRAVAGALVETYAASYEGGSQGTSSITLSNFDLNAFRNSYGTFKNFADALNVVASSNPKLLMNAVRNSKSFYVSEYRDLGSFLDQVQGQDLGVDRSVVSALASQLKEIVTANRGTGSFESVQGLSITLPTSSYFWPSYGSRYVGFKFDQATGWSKWIENISTFQGIDESLASRY